MTEGLYVKASFPTHLSVDAAGARAPGDAEVAVLTPLDAPGILHLPVRFRLENILLCPEPDQQYSCHTHTIRDKKYYISLKVGCVYLSMHCTFPFGIEAYKLLISIMGPKCKILACLTHIAIQVH